MIFCPLCKTEHVARPDFDFASTSVEVEACEACRASTGIVSMSLRKSALFELEPPSFALRHADGLVTFG